MNAEVFGALVLLGGLAAVQLISILKNVLQWDTDKALLLAYLVSGAVGAVVFGIAFALGQVAPEGLVGGIGLVFSLSQAIYRFVVAKQG